MIEEVDSEKKELNGVIQIGDQLVEHPALLEEDRKVMEQQLLNIQDNWDALVTKVEKRMERYRNKIAKLRGRRLKN